MAYHRHLTKGACSNRAHPLEERSSSGIARCAKDLLWRALLHNPSALEIADAISDIGGERHLMGGDQHGRAALCQRTQRLKHIGN